MHCWGRILYLMTTLLYISNGRAQDWDYNDTTVWGDDYPLCNGNQQSPIALNSNSAQTQWASDDGPNSIDFENYDEEVNATVTNRILTVEVHLNYEDESTTPRAIFNVNGVPTTWVFQRDIHFHWPAEHVVDGVRYPLELHMLHQADDGRQLILVYLFRECRRSPPGMDEIAEAVEDLEGSSGPVNISDFAAESVMPRRLSLCDFFQYNGSYTTPPCLEDLIWMVYKKPLCIRPSQMDAFRDNAEATGLLSNSRPLQAPNGRTVIKHRCFSRRRG